MSPAFEIDDVHRFLAMTNRHEIPVCIDGGWGVDALLYEQTRTHADLDVIVDQDDVSRLTDVATRNGYQVSDRSSETNFLLSDDRGKEVDVHVIYVDGRGFGCFKAPDGRVWPLPPPAFAGQGSIGGMAVRCLSAEAQVHCHSQGYEPTEKDLADMERLQQRFDVVLPLSLCRQ